jgi:iron-sulfur cluster insertion protein
MPQKLNDEFAISSQAVDKLAALVNAEDNDDIKGVRIFVSGSGCSGVQYGMTFAENFAPDDSVMECKDLDIYVDAQCLSTMDGIEIDFTDGPNGQSFVFNNTNAPASACGTCGSAGGGCA